MIGCLSRTQSQRKCSVPKFVLMILAKFRIMCSFRQSQPWRTTWHLSVSWDVRFIGICQDLSEIRLLSGKDGLVRGKQPSWVQGIVLGAILCGYYQYLKISILSPSQLLAGICPGKSRYRNRIPSWRVNGNIGIHHDEPRVTWAYISRVLRVLSDVRWSFEAGETLYKLWCSPTRLKHTTLLGFHFRLKSSYILEFIPSSRF